MQAMPVTIPKIKLPAAQERTDRPKDTVSSFKDMFDHATTGLRRAAKPLKKNGSTSPDKPKTDSEQPQDVDSQIASLAASATINPVVQIANEQSNTNLQIPALSGLGQNSNVIQPMQPVETVHVPLQTELPIIEDVPIQPQKVESTQGILQGELILPNQQSEDEIPLSPIVPTPTEQGDPAMHTKPVTARPISLPDATLIQPHDKKVAPLQIPQVDRQEQELRATQVEATKISVIESGLNQGKELETSAPLRPKRMEEWLPQVDAGQPKPEMQPTQKLEPPTTQPANLYQTPNQAEQIRAQIEQNMHNDKMEFRMQLHPEELGKIDVRMVLESGRLVVEILAANPKAVETLSRQSEALAASLRLNNANAVSVQIVDNPQTTSGDMSGAFQMLGQQAGQFMQDNAQNAYYSSHHSSQSTLQDVPEDLVEEKSSFAPKERLNYTI